jgi:hypothetical protein
MPKDKHDPLNPDSEQQLFEKLAMSEEDLKYLNYIRKHVKILVKQEQNGSSEKLKGLEK